jgi:peptidoglycan glycosyltransferase
VNRPIARLFVVVCLLFALLIGFTSRWTVFDAASLRANPLNRRPLLEAQLIRRGAIIADDGTILARSYKGAGGIYQRTYPQAGLFAHAVGYAFTTYGTAATEAYRNDALTGKLDSTQLNTIVDQLSGTRPSGDDVVTTLDPNAQRIALAQLAGRPGAVVALDPRSGSVKVFASTPGYNPNAIPGNYSQLRRAPGSPLFDRVTQAGYPPGSTFKVVTAIAAIDSGQYTPDSLVNGDSPKIISGTPLRNDGDVSWGDITLTDALTHSVNTVWAQVAVALGKPTMARYMNRLGFNAIPPIDLPPDERAASGEYWNGRLISPLSPIVDVGRMGIGQDKLAVTPLQMAMVAAAVGNGGRLMAPHITDRVVDRDGRTVLSVGPSQVSQVMKPQTAGEVGTMMSHVVQEGTGTAAELSGIQVAGKTGTAQTPQQGLSQVWFIAFAPIVNPRVAIAVTVERSTGEGGTVAAPIAKQVMQELLR